MSPGRKRAPRAGAGENGQARVNDELRQLHATVVTLREELDLARIGEQTRVQHAMSTAHQEIDGLRRTIQALRDELDRGRIAEETRVQHAMSSSHQEIDGLRRTMQELRDELDLTVQRARDERHRQDTDWQGRLTEAQRTIVELRRQIEQAHEASRR